VPAVLRAEDGAAEPGAGVYFRLLLIGYFEGLDGERGIAWRAADSLGLRRFLRIGLDEMAPDHSTISRTRRLIDVETHREVAPATKFVTFAERLTGVAYANPSLQTAQINFVAIGSTGTILAAKSVPLLPGEHGAANLGPLLGLEDFTGSIQIVSTVPILSLSLNFEAYPAFSSLPPGELDGATPLR
jgi:hypothetical protein